LALMEVDELISTSEPAVTRRLKSRASKAQSPPSRAVGANLVFALVRAKGEHKVRPYGAFSARGFNRRGPARLCCPFRQVLCGDAHCSYARYGPTSVIPLASLDQAEPPKAFSARTR